MMKRLTAVQHAEGCLFLWEEDEIKRIQGTKRKKAGKMVYQFCKPRIMA